MSAIVAIAQSERIEESINRALGYLDLEKLARGKLVAIKPNDTWASREDTTGVTQGATLRAVIRYLKRFAPRRLVVTGGAGAAKTAAVFEYAGMMAAIKEEGVEFHDHNRAPFVEVALEHGPQPKVTVSEFVTQIETLVSLAQLKVHETATVTLSMKNIAMSFPAADYYGHPRFTEKHAHHFFEDLHGFIVAMVKRFPIQLAVIVGQPAMVGLGPLGGKAVDTGLTIASTDAVAADTVGAQLLGFSAHAVRHLFEAGKLGLGETDIEEMEIRGLRVAEAFKAFTRQVYGEELDLEHA